MEIRTMLLADLIPAPYSPHQKLRKGDPMYERLRRSIEEFGYVDPIVWNKRTSHIVGGDQRRTVMIDLGKIEAEVSVVDLPEDKEKVLNLALKKIQSPWDMPLLKDLIIELESLDIDIELTGFDEAEIEKLLRRDVVEDNFDAEAEAAKITEPKTKRGDIYRMGNHRLMCGDSTIPEDMATLMAGKMADLVYTDPPYNVNYGASAKDKMRNKASKENAGRKILNDHFKDNEGFYQFLRAAIAAFRPYVMGDVYICMSSSELHTLQRAFLDCGGHFSTFIIWIKNHFTIGRANYQRQYEPILYGWFEGTSHYWSGVRNLGDIYGRESITIAEDGTPLVRVEACGIESDIWEFPRPNKSKEHPTMKPIGLCARGIRNSSVPGALVLEAFGGSGSTLMAAEQTSRICHAMELDPKYCDVIINRWEQFTGGKAELIERV